MKEFITMGYTYDELSEYAKDAVKQWYIDRQVNDDGLYDELLFRLHDMFPRSKLDVQYGLSYCQGDGLNIHGTLELVDFLDKWERDDKDKRTIAFYIKQAIYRYEFTRNDRYGYSCKFIDRKYIDASVMEWEDELRFQQIKNINVELIKQFYTDMLDYFEKLDTEFEEFGYKWLYEVEDDEVEEVCMSNEYYFTSEGEFLG